MPTPRKSMRKLKEVLRLKWACGLTHRQISRAIDISVGAVSKFATQAAQAGLDWATAEALSDDELEARLKPVSSDAPAAASPVAQYYFARNTSIDSLRHIEDGAAVEHPNSAYDKVRLCLASFVGEHLQRLPRRGVLKDCLAHFVFKTPAAAANLSVGLKQLIFVLNLCPGAHKERYVFQLEEMFRLDTLWIEERRLKLGPIFKR